MVASSRVPAWALALARLVPQLPGAVADKPAAVPAGRRAGELAGRPAAGPAGGPAAEPAGRPAAWPALSGQNRNLALSTPPKSACRILLRRPAVLPVELPLQMPSLSLRHLQLGLLSLAC